MHRVTASTAARSARMRLATVLFTVALTAARPHGSASDRRALEALEARDQRALALAIAQNRTRLQTIGKCPTIAAANLNDRLRCVDDCETDFECADDEKCCSVGCMVCSKAQLGPRYTETGLAFVFFLLWAWFITCGLVGST